jgi:hypothetical protein
MVQLDGLCPEMVALGGCCMYSACPPSVLLLSHRSRETCCAYLCLPVSAGILRGVLSSVAIAQLNPAFCGMHFPRRHPTGAVSPGFCYRGRV